MKKIIIGLVLILVVIGIAVGIKIRSSSSEDVEELMPTPTIVLPTVSEDIVVEFTPKNNNRVVNLRIEGLTPNMESIEYELTYMTGTGLPRGVLGKISLGGEEEITRDDIVLGTCSSGKCVYDTGVTSVDLALKFNSSTGSSSVFQKTYSFE